MTSFQPISFARHWFRTRDWSQLSSAVPAVVVLVLVASCVWARRSMDPVKRQASLVKNAQSAFAGKNYSRAKFLYLHALRSQPKSGPLRFKHALTTLALGEKDAALEEITSLASVDGGDYVEAHRWLLKRLLAADQKKASEFVRHASAIVGTHPKDVLAREVLASVALLSRNPRAAIEHLPFLLAEKPVARVDYAAALLAVGKKDEARILSLIHI